MLIPPFFFIASLLWGAYLNHSLDRFLYPVPPAHATPDSLETASLKSLLSIIVLVGVATLPIGYAIGVITISILRFFWFGFWFSQWSWEIPISRKGMDEVFKHLGVPPDKKHRLPAAAVFDHVLTMPNVHNWLFRRWTSFLISAQCFTALGLSLFVGWKLGIHISKFWLWPVAVMGVLFGWNAIESWKQAYLMFNFAASVPKARRKDDDEKLASKCKLILPTPGNHTIPLGVPDPAQPVFVYQLDEQDRMPQGQTATIVSTQEGSVSVWRYFYKGKWTGRHKAAEEARKHERLARTKSTNAAVTESSPPSYFADSAFLHKNRQ